MNSATAIAREIIKEIIERGVKVVVLSPGSRNAPLSIALYEAELRGFITLHIRIDERTAGFFALGVAKASRTPVLLVCTSGTAAANYHPAILEAHHSQIPLLVITADRPARLRESGANQTTLQVGIFSSATSYSLDISEVGTDFTPTFLALKTGPVHWNVQFDEPLLPNGQEDWLAEVKPGTFSPEMAYLPGELMITESRGVIVIGHDRGGFPREHLEKFADEIGWPLLAEDPLSFPKAVAHACLFLGSEKIREKLKPETVIVIGRTTLSRSTNLLIKSAGREIVIDPRVATTDSKRSADQLFLTLPIISAERAGVERDREKDLAWRQKWDRYSQKTSELLAQGPVWSEGAIAHQIFEALPAPFSLFISSSRPIRDIEAFARPREGVETFANRGLAGIDGNISTALGIASQRESTIAILGDLSFLHDLTGLIGTSQCNLRILVINNDGGGIFSTLPQAGTVGFEKIFGTPHGQDLEAITKAMGIACVTVDNFDDLLAQMLLPIAGLSVVIAIAPERQSNAARLISLNEAINLF